MEYCNITEQIYVQLISMNLYYGSLINRNSLSYDLHVFSIRQLHPYFVAAVVLKRLDNNRGQERGRFKFTESLRKV